TATAYWTRTPAACALTIPLLIHLAGRFFILINLQNNCFSRIIIFGWAAAFPAHPVSGERTNCGRGCPFSSFFSLSFSTIPVPFLPDNKEKSVPLLAAHSF